LPDCISVPLFYPVAELYMQPLASGTEIAYSVRHTCGCKSRVVSCFLAAMSAAGNNNAQQSSDEPQRSHEHQAVPSDMTLRVKALESLLIEKGLVDPAALDALVDTYENKVGPRNGAQVVARAWVDPAYRKRLLSDA